MRIAVLCDVHGNLPALEAVLGELEADLVVVGGDVAAGPMPAEVLDALSALAVPVRWVMGNADRAVLDPPGENDDSPEAIVDRFAASRLSAAHRELLGGFETTVTEDGVLFCHGTPRSDTETVTVFTPDGVLEEILTDVSAPVVVGAGVPQFRCTPYDIDAAAARIRTTGIPDPDELIRESLLEPTPRDEVARFFESRR